MDNDVNLLLEEVLTDSWIANDSSILGVETAVGADSGWCGTAQDIAFSSSTVQIGQPDGVDTHVKCTTGGSSCSCRAKAKAILKLILAKEVLM